MARQVAPILGAVVGTFFGSPQLGFAIGSIIGNIVDPQRIRAPGLKELPVMGVTEGNFRQVAYGTTVIRDCQLIDWGDLDPVTVEERQGKGGGPVVESQRLYQTYAVAIGEPIEGVRYIKRNGVMVYDVRPGSTILAESAEWLERCRIYLGADDQLPDPDLEALPRNGVGNTPAYRGTSYFVVVRDDLTDLRGQIPTYEVEVAVSASIIPGGSPFFYFRYLGTNGSTTFTDSGNLGITWTRTQDTNGGTLPIISTAQSVFGGSSGLFYEGNSTAVSGWLQGTAIPDLSNGLFTYETFLWISSDPTANNAGPIDLFDGSSRTGVIINAGSTGTRSIGTVIGESVSYPTTLAVETWAHVVIQRRAGDQWDFFINGVLIQTRTSSYSFVSGSAIPRNGFRFSGHLAETRFTRDQALYDPAGFTPPTSPFMLSGTVVGDPVPLGDIVGDICDRCGIPAAKLDLSELTDEVKGVTLGGNYDGAGAITTLMPAFLFDLYSADRELRAVKRGAAVKATLTVDDLLEEPDENTLRGQGIEYPRALQLKYLNPGQDYAAPAATVTNKTVSARVRGEVQIDLPVAFDETEALNVAARMLKVMWEDLNGEAVFSLPAGPFAWLTPTDCLGLVLRGATYRIRVEKVEQTGGQLKVTARRDRQSAYTSNLTAIPLPAPQPPPPSLAGVTTFVPMNIPARIDEDDRLGFVFAMTGLPGTAWQGANLAYRVAGDTDWLNLGNFSQRAVMGQLLADLPAASEFYTDTTNVLEVELIGADELESITQAQFLSEGNPAAIVYADGTAELLQFRDVVDDGSQAWSLSTLLRGRLATVPGPHDAGARFVMLGGSVFVPLPSALIGADLQFRVTSLGTSPEVAPVYDFTWNPVHSQLEFAPVDLVLARGGGTVSGSWTERRRFGTEDNPIASINFEGYRVTLTDGVTTETFDTTLPQFGTSDAAFSGAITVTVQQLNRFTGPGPGTSEVIA